MLVPPFSTKEKRTKKCSQATTTTPEAATIAAPAAAATSTPVTSQNGVFFHQTPILSQVTHMASIVESLCQANPRYRNRIHIESSSCSSHFCESPKNVRNHHFLGSLRRLITSSNTISFTLQ